MGGVRVGVTLPGRGFGGSRPGGKRLCTWVRSVSFELGCKESCSVLDAITVQ